MVSPSFPSLVQGSKGPQSRICCGIFSVITASVCSPEVVSAIMMCCCALVGSYLLLKACDPSTTDPLGLNHTEVECDPEAPCPLASGILHPASSCFYQSPTWVRRKEGHKGRVGTFGAGTPPALHERPGKPSATSHLAHQWFKPLKYLKGLS